MVLAAGLASGCILHVSEDGVSSGYDGDWGDSWRDRQERNRKAIARLDLGTPVEEVERELGSPDFSEAFVAVDGGEYRVFFYRTHHRHSDGDTTRDETTPVVFRDGRVYGFGDDVYGQLGGR